MSIFRSNRNDVAAYNSGVFLYAETKQTPVRRTGLAAKRAGLVTKRTGLAGKKTKFPVKKSGLSAQSGSALLELTIAALLLGFAVFAASNLLAYSSNTSVRQLKRAESHENVRIALDFLINQTQMAHDVTIVTYGGVDTLQQLRLKTITNTRNHTYLLRFEHSGNSKGQLRFGGSEKYPQTFGYNELASGLGDITVMYDEAMSIVTFMVTSADGLYTLTGGVDVKYKKFEMIITK